jgi:hypothetical protein
MIDLIGTVVDVGTAETLYTGRLVEVNEDEIYLETESGWVTVPIDRVAFVRAKED